MIAAHKIHQAEGFVDVDYLPELKAINIRWQALNEDGTIIQDAVNAAFSYASVHKVPHWIGDTSRAHGEMTERDEAWASGTGFRDGMLNTSIKKFALIPPPPGTKQSFNWVAEWEGKMDVMFGGRIAVKLTKDFDEARDFLACCKCTDSI